MLTTIVARIVAASSRHAKLVVLLAALLTALSAYYAVSHFAINTDSDTLIARDLPWRQRQEAFSKAFPQNDDLILVVIDGMTPEAAQDAADRLVAKLKDRSDRFYFVRLPPEQSFFSQDGLLFQPVEKVQQVADQLGKAQPLLATLAAGPEPAGPDADGRNDLDRDRAGKNAARSSGALFRQDCRFHRGCARGQARALLVPVDRRRQYGRPGQPEPPLRPDQAEARLRQPRTRRGANRHGAPRHRNTASDTGERGDGALDRTDSA